MIPIPTVIRETESGLKTLSTTLAAELANLPLPHNPGAVRSFGQAVVAASKSASTATSPRLEMQRVSRVRKRADAKIKSAHAAYVDAAKSLDALESIAAHVRDGSPISTALDPVIRSQAHTLRQGVVSGSLDPSIATGWQDDIEHARARLKSARDHIIKRVGPAIRFATIDSCSKRYDALARNAADPEDAETYERLSVTFGKGYEKALARARAERAAKKRKP